MFGCTKRFDTVTPPAGRLTIADPFSRKRRIKVLAALIAFLMAGCFAVPEASPEPTPSSGDLGKRVRVAFAGHEHEALKYAGLYAVLADRIDGKQYATTSEAAAIAGRAADILRVPGVLKEIVNDELNPLLGKPQPLTPELSSKASEKLRSLAAACKEAAR